jgi:hypothetical protein
MNLGSNKNHSFIVYSKDSIQNPLKSFNLCPQEKWLCVFSALDTAVSALADLVPKVFTFASVA